VGIVTDASGARIPNCEVVVTNLEGSNQEVARANPAGEFAFPAIPAGRYSLEFRSGGFKLLKTEAVVAAGGAATVNATLDVGQVAETVSVKGRKPAGVPAAALAARAAAGPPQRIRVGGHVQATKLLIRVAPVYPPDLESAGVQGTVVLRAVISVTGDLLNLEVASAGVNPGLAKAATDAVRQWTLSAHPAERTACGSGHHHHRGFHAGVIPAGGVPGRPGLTAAQYAQRHRPAPTV
jgi:TonB family protein